MKERAPKYRECFVFTRFYRFHRSNIVFLLPTPATPIFKECQSTDRFDPTWFATSAIEDTEMFNTSASGDH